MKRKVSLNCLSLFVLYACVSQAQIATQEGLVTTSHRIVLGGKTFAYTATAGRLPIINNDAGEPHGYVFFVAYTGERTPSSPVRPLTFLWNGGPGSSSSQVHLMGFGPRRLKTNDTYPTWEPLSVNTTLEDNQETWLDFTDLVFVDPIGTGYSRPTKPEYGSEFFSTVGDAESIAEFIRVYRERFDAFNAPIFLAGESYGTIRAQWVAEALERRRTRVAGIALISGFISLGQKPNPAMASVWAVSSLTAIAYYHKKLSPDLQSGSLEDAMQKAGTWARNEYAPALEKRDSLTLEQRDAVITQLARFAGVAPTLVDAKKLTLSADDLTEHLLQSKGEDLGRYDTRMIGHRDVAKVPWTTFVDPSLSPVMDIMQGTSPTLIRYLRDYLGYKNDLLYRGPFGESYPAPTTPSADWMAASWSQATPAGVPEYATLPGAASGHGAEASPTVPLVPPLQKAMQLNPALHVIVMTGLYDVAAPEVGCEPTRYSVSLIEPSLRDRIKVSCYVGGHMMYTDKTARQEMKRDMEELERGSDHQGTTPPAAKETGR
jgi:carboxypeptidase C (cathepsin A)